MGYENAAGSRSRWWTEPGLEGRRKRPGGDAGEKDSVVA